MTSRDTRSVWCSECDHEHECELVRGEHPDDDYTDIPDCCAECGAELVGAETDFPEDFHADV